MRNGHYAPLICGLFMASQGCCRRSPTPAGLTADDVGAPRDTGLAAGPLARVEIVGGATLIMTPTSEGVILPEESDRPTIAEVVAFERQLALAINGSTAAADLPAGFESMKRQYYRRTADDGSRSVAARAYCIGPGNDRWLMERVYVADGGHCDVVISWNKAERAFWWKPHGWRPVRIPAPLVPE